MGGRASIVGAAETNVGKVREHNEDSHFIDPESGIFIVCDGMGGHAAGEVASALAVKTIRQAWSGSATQSVADRWLEKGTPDARKQLLSTVTSGVLAAHDAIVAEAAADHGKKGMGTTVVAAIVVGGDVVLAHCGDSRAYLVRDGITVQLTEDHTLLARLLAAGVDVDVDGDGARFKSMLTNALGIGHECKVSCIVVPVADGDRFLLCSDGITEYLQENEIGEVLTTMPSPARSAQKLVDIALQRGGGDNATALVVRVLEAGETARPAEQLRKEEQAIFACPLWTKLNVQQRLRALRIALPRDHIAGERIPAHTLGDRVAWIIVEGELEQDGHLRGPGSLIYPEALLLDRPLPDKEGLAVAQSELRALALRADDFKELCDDDPELGEHLLANLGTEITRRRPQRRTGKVEVQFAPGNTDPGIVEEARADTLQRQAVVIPPLDPADIGRGDLGRMDTMQRPAVPAPTSDPAVPVADLARADTGQHAVAIPSADKPRQPRGSTVPPKSARARASTDHGTPIAERAPSESGAVRRPRGSTPPVETRSSLISTPADTAAAVDAAMTGMESTGDEPSPAATMRRPAPLRPPAPPTLRSGPSVPPPAPVMTHQSDPDIHIEQLEELADSDLESEAVELSLDDVADADAPRPTTLTVDD